MKRHQKFLTDRSDPLVQEQPFPNKYALSVPMVIVVRPKIATIGLFYMLIAPIALVFAWLSISGLVLFFISPSDTYNAGDNPLISSIAGAALFSLVCFYGSYGHTHAIG